MQANPLRIAIIGCGAVAELGYLPAAMKLDNTEIVMLVDRDTERAGRIAEENGILILKRGNIA